jgi:5-methylcytosine-specific restriction endonuclease McrA
MFWVYRKERASDCFVGVETDMGLQTLRPRVSIAKLSTATSPPKVADPFYSSREWTDLRNRVRWEAGSRCQALGCGRRERTMFVDHKVELRDGGSRLDRDNLWLLCGRCHSLKTSRERIRRTAERHGGGRCKPASALQTALGPTQREFPARHNPKRRLTRADT